MSGLALALLVVAPAVWVHLRPRPQSRHAAVRALAVFVVAMLAHRVLGLSAARLGPDAPALAVLAAAAAGAALVSWAALWTLVAVEWRRGRRIWRFVLLGLVGVLWLAGVPWGVPAGFACLAVLSTRWTGAFTTRQLLSLALAGVALLVAGAAVVPAVPAGAPELAARLLGFGAGLAVPGGFYLVLATLAAWGGFVRDPSLGIRTAARRLALSHVLVVAVPLLLLGALWAFAALLGASRDRAAVAVRLLELESGTMERVARAALGGEDPARALAAAVEAHADRWPRAHAWLVEDGRARRVAGPEGAADAVVARWPDSLGAVPSRGLVSVPDLLALGAVARDTAAGRAAVVLAPAESLLARAVEPVARARVRVRGGQLVAGGGAVRLDVDDADDPRADPDSLAAAIRRGVARDSIVRGLRFTAGGDTFPVSPGAPGEPPVLLRGHAVSRGAAWRRDAFVPRSFLVSASAPPREALLGMFAMDPDDPMAVLPVLLFAVAALAALLVAAFDVIMVTGMGRSITGVIHALKTAAARLEAGDLDHRIEVRGRDDLWDVAATFNQAAAGLARARQAERERQRLEGELEVARRIQARLLPEGPPDVPGLEIAGVSESARQVGGDFFDHLDLGGGRVLLVIADVSGKGVPAALLMSGFRASLMSQDLSDAAPEAVAGRLNEFLVRSVQPGRFVTAFLGFLDGASGRLAYVNAGHNPPFVVRRDGAHETLAEGGTILGIMSGAPFARGETALAPGDLLALYTDGVTEGAAEDGTMWGEERLLAALREGRARPCRELAARIVSDVRAFEGAQGPADDITLLLARRTG